ncbi:uncharacterized protein TAF1C-like [Fopius arisanus]|uniref:Uncharacterized protein TAF1C-like n=1 Tax=Fopius arisanus TaxID=64838 RepID=A0A9R1T0T2_9HYME|nr:PREDICTED: uncharacterized protein LOC105265035 [Fopius arisanus]
MARKKDVNTNERLQNQDRALIYLQGKHWSYDRWSGVFSYDVPGLNLNKSPWIEEWNVENARNLYQPFPWNCDYPKPLLPPVRLPRGVLCKGDPGLDILLKKSYIAEDVERMTQYFTHKLKNFDLTVENIKSKTEGFITTTALPKFVADLSELMDMDPDPEFTGKYNYYFNGGSLGNFRMNGENVLVFPYMEELVVAPLIYRENSIWKPNLKRAAKCELKDQVFELKQTAFDCGYQLMTRSKHSCEFFSVVDKGNKLRVMSKQKCSSSVPIISADTNPFNPQDFCTVNIMRKIALRDVETGVQRLKAELPKSTMEDRWRSIKFQQWKPHIITLADRCCIHYLDVRRSMNTPVLTIYPKPYINDHEWVSLEISSNNEACHYVGTSQSLLMLDSRRGDVVRQKWSHQLQSAPVTGNLLSHEGREIITLASQISGDVKIILNTWEDSDEPHSFHLPYAPASILDTLRESHLLGKCLNPLMRTRLKLSTAGSQLIQDESQNIYLFTQNSIGDIFYQGLNYEEVLDKNSYVNTNAYYALEVWEKRMLEQNFVAPVVISDQSNMGKVFEAFTNKDLKYQEPVRKVWRDREKSSSGKWREEAQKRKKKKKSEEEKEPPPRWKHSIKRLSQYTDRLAPALLEVWEVTGHKDQVPQTSANEKVFTWLQNSEDKSPEISLSQGTLRDQDDDCVLTPVFSQELISVSQQQEPSNHFENPEVQAETLEFDEDLLIDDDYGTLNRPKQTANVTKQKENKRKNNFTVGF